MRGVPVLVCMVAVSVALAERPALAQPLTAADIAALAEPSTVGRRVVAALAQYLDDAPKATRVDVDRALLTRTPTIEILHAFRYISDSDFALCRRYQATLHPIPSDAPATQAVLSMQTDRGVLVFQTSGDLALEVPK